MPPAAPTPSGRCSLQPRGGRAGGAGAPGAMTHRGFSAQERKDDPSAFISKAWRPGPRPGRAAPFAESASLVEVHLRGWVGCSMRGEMRVLPGKGVEILGGVRGPFCVLREVSGGYVLGPTAAHSEPW